MFTLRHQVILTYPHLSSSSLVAHKAAVHSFQFLLFLATCLAWFREFHHNSLLSFSTVLLQVVLGCPTFLRTSGLHVNAVMQSLVSSILSTCPNHFQLLIFTIFSQILICLILLKSYLHFSSVAFELSILLLSTSFTLQASHL